MADMLTDVVPELSEQRLPLDLEVVLDCGGSGLLWRRLAAELCGELENRGAFRHARFRTVDSDSPDDLRGPATTDPSTASTSPQAGTLFMVLTDGTGQAWQTGDIYRWLRGFLARGIVLTGHLLPTAMWSRTALRAVRVPCALGHAENPQGLQILEADDLEAAQVIPIPVVELTAQSIHPWVPWLKGAPNGTISGYVLLIPESDADQADWIRPQDAGGPIDAQERVQRFGVIASPEANRLARQLSTIPREVPLSLSSMLKAQERLLPDSDLTVLAEILLGGLVYQAAPADGRQATNVTFEFYSDVLDLLSEQLASQAQLPSLLAQVPVSRAIHPRAAETEDSEHPERPGAPDAMPLRIAFWGSPTSGKTTFLAVLADNWWPSPKGYEWRVKPEGEPTKTFMKDCILGLKDNQFPPSTATSNRLSFNFMRRPQRSRWPIRRKVVAADIQVELEDMSASSFHDDHPREEALEYLSQANCIVYFFDATYDAREKRDLHAVNFFQAADARLHRLAAEHKTIVDGYLPHHVAVCIPKLDDRIVFGAARRYGCLETDRRTGLPWVPGRHARRLFEVLCREQMSPQSDTLLSQLRHSFHPDRISFHVLSSVGFWVGEGKKFDPRDACNVVKPDPEATESVIRGPINPVRVVDPLVALIERASQAGNQMVRP